MRLMNRPAGAQLTPDLAESRWRRLLLARAGTRLITAATLGSAVFALTMALTAWQVALLAGLDTTTGVVVVWVFIAVWSRTSDETAHLARREDDSRAAAHVLLVSAAVASLVAVGFGLVKAAGEDSWAKIAITALAVVSVALSWAAVQATYTLRYAHRYYGEHGGIDFNEESAPDYRDFAYVAFTIGMTYQVSDTNLTSRSIRRIATEHALLSYLFGTVIVAVMINVVAGLVR
jgi:uncharacterized membrane protein